MGRGLASHRPGHFTTRETLAGGLENYLLEIPQPLFPERVTEAGKQYKVETSFAIDSFDFDTSRVDTKITPHYTPFR